MFTGIVRGIGVVADAGEGPGGRRIVIDPGGWDHRPEPGDSVCCSGCCLTLVERVGAGWAFDAVPETLAKTTLGGWEPGRRVNLEAAARVGDRLDGHVVQGHVDGVGVVEAVTPGGGAGWRVRVRVDGSFGRYLVPKGSVAVDGVSLTLAETGGDEAWFGVALIPETLARTTMGGLVAGDRVNVEFDAMAKTVVHAVERVLGGRA